MSFQLFYPLFYLKSQNAVPKKVILIHPESNITFSSTCLSFGENRSVLVFKRKDATHVHVFTFVFFEKELEKILMYQREHNAPKFPLSKIETISSPEEMEKVLEGFELKY